VRVAKESVRVEMSKRPSVPQRSTLAAVLRDVLRRTASTLYSDRAALYVAQLTDPDGFSLAERVHAQVPGPDPEVLLDRARARLLRVPFMPGAAPVETLARILETLGADAGTAALRAWAVREAHASGAVPVVFVQDGSAVVTTLAALEEMDVTEVGEVTGWFQGGRAEA
jgi:hypothetical protein